ncbi:DUF262 domain-containing protein [Pectobacterium versatile]|uniref:DUF262 domain-containing protein n=1 Tax=Pectobacterium versatile TaxID=2488639 RepID=A0A855MCM3_9GAMM|nr:DUF262 domain-containing protein [Pectobacterium versatile]MBN3194342.1 DUF262 domain-containing protein [Pectobacterium versatile]MBQ4788855.1 DUF262 domain-containing protein [Pectobacterium versatile]POY48144.1 hypothetical protein F131LOC_04128 [Pectobacterium versatile]QPK16196.1 DUF262 domain-containing protein [Pectobacterium versatile]TAI93632.1 DUF262 domain-containing protein [Pectobacterium versatile]
MATEYNEGLEEIESEERDLESTPAAYEVITYPADFTLEGLVSKYRKGSMIVPGFQRNYVWNIKQASRLIESFLLGLPVPAIFLFTDEVKNEQLVIDGQQRLMSVVYFFDGYFGGADKGGRKKVFRLTGLNEESPYHDKTYSDLEESDQAAFNKLNDSVLRAFVIKQITPNGNTSVYHIFERLNTGGTQLVGQEIRNCVYHGSFNELLCNLNKYENWRRIFGNNSSHKRQKDVELILRFFAFFENGDNYERPIKDFMSNYMRENQHMRIEKQEELSLLFKKSCDQVIEHLGDKPFHIWSGLNVAVFDSVFTVLAKNGFPDDLMHRFESLKSDDAFIQGVRGATADESIVELRMSLARQYLVK